MQRWCDGSNSILRHTISCFTAGLTIDSDNTDKESNKLLDTAVVTLKGCAVAVPLGIVGRGLIKGYHVPTLPFTIVTLVSTLVI